MSDLITVESKLEEQIQKFKRLRKVFCTPFATHTRNQLYIDFIDVCDELIDINEDVVEEYGYSILYSTFNNNVTVKLTNPNIGWHRPWDEISHFVNEVHSNTQLKFEYDKSVTVGGVVFKISDYVAADIPEEDIHLLKLLGKIKEMIIPSSISHTMMCGEV